MADLKAQLEITADASGVETGVNRAKKSLANLGAAATKEGAKASEGVVGIGKGGEKASAKLDAATRNIIGSIQRTTAALEAGSRTGSKYFETLAAQRGVSTEVLKPYLAQLDAVTAKQKVATTALAAAAPTIDRVGMSAKATAAALRGVPAQFTDIVTSLQAGQAPLTVFLQQGGQLKDMFGGIGPAARALGGYVAGLINPFTLAAGAVAALGIAYFQGSKEADAFAKAIILSGNAAGTTVGQLTEMAKGIDRVVGTQAAASEALAKFAADGNIASGNLERFTTVALKLEKEAGQAVADTVKQFAELGKDPVAASIKLNETTRFLTDTVYKQIKALDEQGRTADAAAVAQKAYADALDGRIGQLTSRLGVFQRAWQMLGKDAKEAWDLMLGIGRPDTLQEKIGNAQADLAKRMQRGPLNSTTGEAFARGNADLQARIDAMQETVRLENRSANAQKESADRVKARIEFDKEADKYLSRKVQMEREIAKANVLADKAGASAAERAKIVAGIQDKYKDPKGPKTPDTTRVDDRAQALLDIADIKAKADALISTYANTERILEAQRSAGLVSERDYYAEKKRLLEQNVQAQIGALNAENDRLNQEKLNTKDGLDRDRKVLENKQKIAKLTADTTASQTILDIQATAAIKARSVALLSATQAAQDYFDTLNLQQERELASFGKGQAQRDLNSGIAQIEDRYTGQRRDIENIRARLQLEGKFTEEARKHYEDHLQIINDFQAKSIASFTAGYEKRRALEKNFSLGAQEALTNYADEARNVFDQTNKAVTSAFKGMEDALVDFVKTGKLDFKSLVNSILADIARIAIKQSITGPLANALGGALGGSSAGSSGSGIFGSLLSAGISAFGGAGGLSTGAAATAANVTGGGLDDFLKFTRNFSGRAIGGPVSSGGIYRVNERRPELLEIGNQQLLMMNGANGNVKPSASAGGSVSVTNNFHFTDPQSRKTQDQLAAAAVRGGQKALGRIS